MDEAQHLYKLQDFFKKEDDRDQLRATKINARLEDTSPRSRVLAPPHLPVKKYLFLGQQRRAKFEELQQHQDTYKTQEAGNSDLEQPKVIESQMTGVPGVKLELLQPLHVSKYPKPIMKVQLSPYPNLSTDTLDGKMAATIISPKEVSSSCTKSLPRPAKTTITTGMKSQNIVKIINKDRVWQERNISRVAASIRQNRIPHLKYFTSDYDHTKVHQHVLQKQIEEQMIKVSQGKERGTSWKPWRKGADAPGTGQREQEADALDGVTVTKDSDTEAFLTGLLQRAESKDGYKLDVSKFRKHSRRASDEDTFLSPVSDTLDGRKPLKTDTLGMIRIMEEKSVEIENMEDQRMMGQPYTTIGPVEAPPEEDFVDDSSMDIDQLHQQIEMFSKNIDELRDFTKRMSADNPQPRESQTFVTQGLTDDQELHKSNTFNPLTQNINRPRYQLNYFSSGGLASSLPMTQQNWGVHREGGATNLSKKGSLHRTASIQNAASTMTGGMNTLLQIRKQQQANYLRNDGLKKDSLQSELKDVLQRHHFQQLQSAKRRSGRRVQGMRHVPQKSMKLRKETAKLNAKQKQEWAKRGSQTATENPTGKDIFVNSNRVISEALKKNCINLQGMKIQEMVQKQKQILSMNNEIENEYQYAGKSRSLASVTASGPLASQQEGTFNKEPALITDGGTQSTQGKACRRPYSGAYLMTMHNRNKAQYITCSSLPAEYEGKALQRKRSSSKVNEQQDQNLLHQLQLHINEGKANQAGPRVVQPLDISLVAAKNNEDEMAKWIDHGGTGGGSSNQQALNLTGQSMKLLETGKEARMNKSLEMQMKAIHALQAINSNNNNNNAETRADLSSHLRSSDPAPLEQSLKKLDFQSFEAAQQDMQETSFRKDLQNGINEQPGFSYGPKTHELVVQQCQRKKTSNMSQNEGSDEGDDGAENLIVQEKIMLHEADGSSRVIQSRKASQLEEQPSRSAEDMSNCQERQGVATILRDPQQEATAASKNLRIETGQTTVQKGADQDREPETVVKTPEPEAQNNATNSESPSGMIKVEVHKVLSTNGSVNKQGSSMGRARSPEGEQCQTPAKAPRSLVLSKSKQHLNESQQFQLIIQAHEFNKDNSEKTGNITQDEAQAEANQTKSNDGKEKQIDVTNDPRPDQSQERMIESVYVLRKRPQPLPEDPLDLQMREMEQKQLEMAMQKQYDAAANQATFYERKAFVDDFRRKWREDRGMVSLFDKRQKYRQANQRVKSAAAFRAIGGRNTQHTVGSYQTAKKDQKKLRKQNFRGICVKGAQANIDPTLSAASAAKQYKLKRNEKPEKRLESANGLQGGEGDQETQKITARVGPRQVDVDRGTDHHQAEHNLDTHQGDPPGGTSGAANEPSAVSRARRVAKLQRKHMHQILDLQEQQSSPIILGIASFGSQRSQKSQESITRGPMSPEAALQAHNQALLNDARTSQLFSGFNQIDSQGTREDADQQSHAVAPFIQRTEMVNESADPVQLSKTKKPQRTTPQLHAGEIDGRRPEQFVKQSKTQTRLEEPLSALSPPSHFDVHTPNYMKMMSDTGVTAELQTQHQESQFQQKSLMLKVEQDSANIVEEEQSEGQPSVEKLTGNRVLDIYGGGQGMREENMNLLDKIVENENH